MKHILIFVKYICPKQENRSLGRRCVRHEVEMEVITRLLFL